MFHASVASDHIKSRRSIFDLLRRLKVSVPPVSRSVDGVLVRLNYDEIMMALYRMRRDGVK